VRRSREAGDIVLAVVGIALAAHALPAGTADLVIDPLRDNGRRLTDIRLRMQAPTVFWLLLLGLSGHRLAILQPIAPSPNEVVDLADADAALADLAKLARGDGEGLHDPARSRDRPTQQEGQQGDAAGEQPQRGGQEPAHARHRPPRGWGARLLKAGIASFMANRS